MFVWKCCFKLCCSQPVSERTSEWVTVPDKAWISETYNMNSDNTAHLSLMLCCHISLLANFFKFFCCIFFFFLYVCMYTRVYGIFFCKKKNKKQTFNVFFFLCIYECSCCCRCCQINMNLSCFKFLYFGNFFVLFFSLLNLFRI